jgi:hypothetical protein
MEYPNKIYICEYTGKNSFDKMSHFVITVAASDADTARQYVKDKIGIDTTPTWLMNAVHPTIWSSSGNIPAPIQVKILSNNRYHEPWNS